MTSTQETERHKVALVTGASSGIGLELARIFARHGYNLVLVARNQTKLNDLSKEVVGKNNVAVTVLAKDLAVTSAPSEIYEQLQRESMSVDALVNCAGFGTLGSFSGAGVSTQLSMIQVNVIALTQLTHLFLGEMLKRGRGKILNVASTAAFEPGPFMAVYYATKAYVLSFSEAIANEVRGTGVTVTTLCPGPTQTSFQDSAQMQKTRLFNSPPLKAMPAEAVAKVGYEGLMSGKTVVIPGAMNNLGVLGVKLMPRSWAANLVRGLHEPA